MIEDYKMELHSRTISFVDGESICIHKITGMKVDPKLGLIAYTTKPGISYHIYRNQIKYCIVHPS